MREILVVALTIALLGGLAPDWIPQDSGNHGGGGGMELAGIPGGSGGGGMALAGPPGDSGE